jgi:hypothetical protein
MINHADNRKPRTRMAVGTLIASAALLLGAPGAIALADPPPIGDQGGQGGDGQPDLGLGVLYREHLASILNEPDPAENKLANEEVQQLQSDYQEAMRLNEIILAELDKLRAQCPLCIG